MAKSKKKTNAPNIAFIERIEIQIKDKRRQQMLKRAPKPAGANTGDILNQQYLLQRTLAQRIQPQQQSQTVNVYLSDVAKLQQQETLKRIDEDRQAAIIRQQRGGINQERLDTVLLSLLEQKQQVKKEQPPPQSFDYGFIDTPAPKVSERETSIKALEKLNKAQGPELPRVAFFDSRTPEPAPIASSRRSLSVGERRNMRLEAEERVSTLSKLSAQELTAKYPDLVSEIMSEGRRASEGKYKKRRDELKVDIEKGKLSAEEAASQLADFASVIGLERKPRFRESKPTVAAVATLSPSQEVSFTKTATVLKKSSVSTAQLTAAISTNASPAVSVESTPAAEGMGGQSQLLRDAQGKKLSASGGRARQSQLLQPTQQTIPAMFKQSSAAADNLVEAGGSSPVATPPPSRPGTAESQTQRAAVVKRQPTAQPGQLPNLGGN
jgi:hypothetical protein